METIKIKDITNSHLAVSSIDGDKVFNIIDSNFRANKAIKLDFEGIELTITAFLNSSIGKLYSIYEVDKIREFLKIVNLKQDEIELLKLVIEKAKERFGSDFSNENDIVDEA
jgi:hypothetical protein